VTSLSHLGDFVQACIELWERRAPFGIYNVANPGAVTIRRVVEMIHRILKPGRPFRLCAYGDEFDDRDSSPPHCHCILDITKMSGVGVRMRRVEDALEDALDHWRTAAPSRPELDGVTSSLLTSLSGLPPQSRQPAGSSAHGNGLDEEELQSECLQRRGISLRVVAAALSQLGSGGSESQRETECRGEPKRFFRANQM
jgi:hypothetical protein